MRKKIKITLRVLLVIFIAGYLFPQRLMMPVERATKNDYNPKTFWYYPWGRSVTHKGVDIFAPTGRNVLASTSGMVLMTNESTVAGKFVLMLGPKWRFHYYSHLSEISAKPYSFVKRGEKIGTVGDSGNAKGKPPHLHYSIVTPVPYVWRIDTDRQGWKKMFYLNPIDYFGH